MTTRTNTGLNEAGRCKGCGKAQVRFDTNPLTGRLVEIASPCRCAYWRRVHCICRYCERPTVGKPKVSLYCLGHRKLIRKMVEARSRAKADGAYERRYVERHRAEIRARAREYAQAHRSEKNEYKQEWRKKNRDRIQAQKRRAALRRSPHSLEYQQRYRAEVAAGTRLPAPARRNARGERLCLTPGCRAVMQKHEKKCRACKLAEAGGRLGAAA